MIYYEKPILKGGHIEKNASFTKINLLVHRYIMRKATSFERWYVMGDDTNIEKRVL